MGTIREISIILLCLICLGVAIADADTLSIETLDNTEFVSTSVFDRVQISTTNNYDWIAILENNNAIDIYYRNATDQNNDNWNIFYNDFDICDDDGGELESDITWKFKVDRFDIPKIVASCNGTDDNLTLHKVEGGSSEEIFVINEAGVDFAKDLDFISRRNGSLCSSSLCPSSLCSCRNIDCRNINCWDINCWNINCWNINCWNIDCRNIDCQDIILCEKLTRKDKKSKITAKMLIENRSKLKQKEW